ncbi:MAG: Hexuronate transporter [Acidobacteria bacterium ADurb.Bin051]|nr:MAG: Hexuronate transporter [Acidobacteria bacterium ADurb.Bin051]
MTADSLAPSARPLPPPFYRWVVLLFVSLAMFGNYYVYDSMAPVFDLLKERLAFSDQQLGLLYTVYSIAAILVLLAGGYVIDRFGTKRSIALFAVVCVVAAVVTAATGRLPVMLSGRFLLGLGSEPLIVAVTTALARWFKGKELSLAFGLNLTIARLGSVAADLSPSWARPFYRDWQSPLWLATAIAGITLSAALLYWLLEHRAEGRYQLGSAGAVDRLERGGLYSFSASYWYIVALCVVFYSVVFPFRAFAIKYFIEAHGASRELGGLLNSMLPFAAMVATPLFGYLVDRVGRRSLFMTLGSLLLLPLFLGATYLPPGREVSLWLPFLGQFTAPLTLLVIMALLGIAFSLIPAVMWPSVAYIVEERRLGSAYALMTLCQQVGMAFVPWFIGVLNDRFAAGPANPAGYAPGMWLFTLLASLGLLFSFLLWRAEHGPRAHGLETITIRKEEEKQGDD